MKILGNLFAFLTGVKVWQKCKIACNSQPGSAGFCPCNLFHSNQRHQQLLHKRSLPEGPSKYDENLLESLLVEDILNDLLIQEVLESSLENGNKVRYYNEGADSGPVVGLTQLRKRSNAVKSNGVAAETAVKGDDDSDSLKMVRSKKRWLSLHDQFDSSEQDADMKEGLWTTDSSRKTFRYGRRRR